MTRKNLLIRNSTAEFLIFQAQSQADGVEVFYQGEMLWLTQKAMATLFNVGIPAISKHLKNIFGEGELAEDSVISKMETTASDGKNYMTRYYNLDAVISVGYRVNSIRATQFRQWATTVLRQFAIRGYVLDKKRMENGAFLTEDYFEHLLAEEHMGLTTWEKAPDGKIVKTDVSIAKNYLKGNELESLGRIVNAFLDLAEDRAKRHIPMTMEDWAKYTDRFLTMDDRELLQDNGKVSAEQAKEFAESEFEKYRIVQDRLFMSDFDKEIEGLLEKKD
ncbi:MAG: virulence RhuM family protein [Paludibacteraceae bacterium]|nr:virulence RhuM family protein [Paludibacteraceae bacterium]